MYSSGSCIFPQYNSHLMQTPLPVMDVVLAILHKCLQQEVYRENSDLTLIFPAIEIFLTRTGQCRIFAKMVLSNYFKHEKEKVREHLILTEEDIQAISVFVKCQEETEDILLFLAEVKEVDGNSHALLSFGGLDLLAKVIDSSEREEDIDKAAILLEALLSEGTQEIL